MTAAPAPDDGMERHADKVNDALQAYLTDYVFEGDEGSYTPNGTERLLIEDAIQGLMVDDDFIAAFAALHSKHSADEDDQAVQDKYFAFIAENYAGELLLNKESLESAITRQLYWPEFLADMAKRRA